MVEEFLDAEIEEKVLKTDHPVILDFWKSGMCSLSGPGACVRRIIGRRERH